MDKLTPGKGDSGDTIARLKIMRQAVVDKLELFKQSLDAAPNDEF